VYRDLSSPYTASPNQKNGRRTPIALQNLQDLTYSRDISGTKASIIEASHKPIL